MRDFYAPPRLNGPERCMQYAQAVMAGQILVCVKVRLAVERFMRDLERVPHEDYPWVYDTQKAGRPVEFMERFLVPTKGNYDRLDLMPWQCFAICNVYGWVSKETGLRRFREALIYVGSGNGKSTMRSALATYMVCKDGERGADVTLFANSKDQADIVYSECKKQIENCPTLYPKHFRTTNDGIFYDSQSQAGASQRAATALVDAVESFKDARQVLGGNTCAIVLKGEKPLVVLLLSLHGDGRAFAGIVDGIVYQVAKDAVYE